MILLRDTEPGSNPQSHGGQHRTAQIDELARGAGFQIHYMPRELPLWNFQRYLGGLACFIQSGFSIPASIRYLRRWGGGYLVYKNGLKSHPCCKLLLWENTHSSNWAAPYLARKLGFRVVAMPQNIEAFVFLRKKATRFFTTSRLGEEVEYLRQAHQIICISREEQWLLSLFGIAADFLPYYPPLGLMEQLLKVRELRSGRDQKRFLILGSAGNQPTGEGMRAQLNLLKKIPAATNMAVDIAGYGTESLKPFLVDNRFTLHGSVEPAHLETLLINARAVLIHQTKGVGALTRIPEMLVAGIPVIVNSIAARSAMHYLGVHCYESEANLAQWMNQALAPPPVPARPLEAETRFQECLRTQGRLRA